MLPLVVYIFDWSTLVGCHNCFKITPLCTLLSGSSAREEGKFGGGTKILDVRKNFLYTLATDLSVGGIDFWTFHKIVHGYLYRNRLKNSKNEESSWHWDELNDAFRFFQRVFFEKLWLFLWKVLQNVKKLKTKKLRWIQWCFCFFFNRFALKSYDLKNISFTLPLSPFSLLEPKLKVL